MQQRTAADLFKRGTLVPLDDGAGEIVSVWVQKLSPVDRQACITAARSAKARILATLLDEDSDEWMAFFADALDMGEDRELMASYLIAEEYLDQVASIEAKMADDADDENNRWAKDGFYRSIEVAWHGTAEQQGAIRHWAEWISERGTFDADGAMVDCPDPGPQDPPEVQEAFRLYNLIIEFNNEVDRQLEHVREDLIASYAQRPVEELRKSVVRTLIEERASAAEIAEFNIHRIYHTTREPSDRQRRHFASVDHVRDADEAVQKELVKRYETEVEVPSHMGKGLQAKLASFASSELPETPEGSAASGQMAATA